MQKFPGKQLGLNPCQILIVSLAVAKSPMQTNGPRTSGDADPVKKNDCGISLQENTQVWKLLDVILSFKNSMYFFITSP